MVYHRDQWVVFSGKMVMLYINKAHASFHPIYLHGGLYFVRAAPYVLPLYLQMRSIEIETTEIVIYFSVLIWELNRLRSQLLFCVICNNNNYKFKKKCIMLLWKKISKDDLVLTCGVAFLEIEWTSGSLFY
jgi:hypothetical protein